MALRSTNQSSGVPERILIADARKRNDPGNKNKKTKNDPPPKPNPTPSPTPIPSPTPSTSDEDGVIFPPPIGGPGLCPDPNTLILLSNGKQKRAGDLQVGDTLRTQHEDTLEWGDYEVTYVNISQSDKVSLTFDHADIICSKTHKFYVENKGWTEVNQIEIGDAVLGINESHKLLSVTDYGHGDVVVIQVKDAHTYISAGLLSHNKSVVKPPEEIIIERPPINVTTTIYGTANRTGTSVRVNSTYTNKSLGNRIVGMDVLPYLRSRNIEFKSKKLKPFTTVYAFFDGQAVASYIVPKILEIEMVSGSFVAGETVSGTNLQAESVDLNASSTETQIKFRLANFNHKYGAFNSPSDIYSSNPYNRDLQLQPYSETSTTLNVDLTSLSDFALGLFGGNVFVGMTLIGNQSGATARVVNRRLVTDNIGTVQGSFFVPNPNILENPKFGTGNKVFRITDNPSNSTIAGSFLTYATANFFSDGLLTQSQETNLSIRNVEIQTAYTNESKAIERDIDFVIPGGPPIVIPVVPGPPGEPAPPGPPTPVAPPTPGFIRPLLIINGEGDAPFGQYNTSFFRGNNRSTREVTSGKARIEFLFAEDNNVYSQLSSTTTAESIFTYVNRLTAVFNVFMGWTRYFEKSSSYGSSQWKLLLTLMFGGGLGGLTSPGSGYSATLQDYIDLFDPKKGFGGSPGLFTEIRSDYAGVSFFNRRIPPQYNRTSYFDGDPNVDADEVTYSIDGTSYTELPPNFQGHVTALRRKFSPGDLIVKNGKFVDGFYPEVVRVFNLTYTGGAPTQLANIQYTSMFPLLVFGGITGTQQTTETGRIRRVILDKAKNPTDVIRILADWAQLGGAGVTPETYLGERSTIAIYVKGRNKTVQIKDLVATESPDEVVRRALEIQATDYPDLDSYLSGVSALSSGSIVSTNECINDPLAQTFRIGSDINPSGRFATSVDLYFQSVSNDLPVYVELRPVELGLPTTKIYPFSRVELLPSQISISEDGSLATTVQFHAPVYLEGNKEHAIVISSNSTDYNVFVARLGEIDITTINSPESEQRLVTTQPILGSLFKSQNASTWTPSQYEDLKFRLNCASFVTTGTVNFFNPVLDRSNDQVALLRDDALDISSRRVRVGLGTTLSTASIADFTTGTYIVQNGTTAIGDFAFATGIATGSLNVINSGIGYTPTAGVHTFNDVSLVSVTGNGRDATAQITVNSGSISSAGITSGGTGYQVGDILTVSQLGTEPLGRNLRLSLQGLYGLNELVIDNVQGEFEVGTAKSIQYYSPILGVGYSSFNGGEVYATSAITEREGLDIKVNHRNHGMHSPTNIVSISNASPDIAPIKLFATIERDYTGNISVTGLTTEFNTFEGIDVSATNPGYIIMNSEIISYTGIGADSLTGITRGVDSTLQIRHPEASNIYKYELGGVSLRRINTTHTLQDSNVTDPIDLDYYHIRIDTSSNGIDRSTGIGTPKLYFNSTKSTGGNAIRASQNIQYDIAHPIVQTFTPAQTEVTASIRTISGTSVDGLEPSFEDKGSEALRLNESNYFDSPRLVCSRVNENSFLDNIMQGNKSMQVTLNLSTTNRYLTPMVDLDRVGMILTSNKVNNPITSYDTDPRTATLEQDPNAFVYASKPIELEFPATSLKVILSAHLNVYNDIRAFFALLKDINESPVYYPFPGSGNLTSSGKTVDLSRNTGGPDAPLVTTFNVGYESEDLEFLDYEFTANDLESFKFFSIKLIGSSTSQTYPPRFRDLRVLALA